MDNECVMNPDAKAVLDDWLGEEGNYEVLHRWYCNETLTYYLCIRQADLLFFLRVFLVGEKWVVSQDRGHID